MLLILFCTCDQPDGPRAYSASEMTYIVSSGALNSTHSLTQPRAYFVL